MFIVNAILGLAKEGLSFLNKKEDAAVEKYKVDGKVDVAAMQQDTEIIKARAALAAALKDDPVVRWGRRLFIYPVGVWFSLIVYRSIFQEHPVMEQYTWVIKALPDNLHYIPYAVVAFLFVSAWKK